MDRLLVLLVTLGTVDGFLVHVSQKIGRDNQSCLTSNASTPCETLQYALKAQSSLNSSDTELRLEVLDDLYLLGDEVAIDNESRDNSIIITSGPNRTNITCVEGGIFNVSDAHDISFVDLNFQECGPRFAAVVLLWRSRNITFHRCTFRNNRRACINAFNSSVAIEDCAFRNNTSNARDVIDDARFVPGNVSAGGGVAFLFRDAKRLSVTIKRSNFSFNKAVVNDSENFIDHSFNVSHFTNGGGGILIVFSGSTENCNVTIDDARLYNNSASYGGGVYVAADNQSKNNRFLLDHTKLIGNHGSQAGGAMGVTQWDNVTSTSVVVRHSIFEDNWSRRGAGVNVFFYNMVETVRDSELTFKNVTFARNRGNSSTALRLASSLPLGTQIPAANIFNCSFVNHAQTERVAYTAPLTSQKVNIVFKGNNVFRENTQAGAAEFQNTILQVHDSLEFVANTGVQGGALILRSSQMKLHPHSEVLFAHNQADTMGGAIAVSNHMMYEVLKRYNPDCFLVYSVPHTPPSEWEAKISFVNNTAKLKGAAIYIASLFACQWDELPPHANISRALRWNNTKFVFDGNCLNTEEHRETCSEDEAIATDTASFKITSPHTNSSTFKVAPGERFKIIIQGLDQLENEVYTVASVSKANRSSPLILHNSMHVLVPAINDGLSIKYNMKCKYYETQKDSNTKYKIEVTDPYSTFNNRYSFELQIQPCPAGFTFNKTKSECVCGQAEGVLRCEQGRFVILKKGYWAGVSNSSGRGLITYYCPYKYCACTTSECKVDLSQPDGQCGSGRTGTLCGKCPPNQSVGLRWYNCVENCHSSWILGVVVGVVVLLSVFIIWLNPAISSELRGPLFFFQALPIIIPPTSALWGDVVNIFANILNFGGPFVFLKNSCIQNGITNLQMVAIGYVMPLVTLGIFIFSYVLSANGLVRLKFRARSSLHSFWLLMLFVYHYLVETTFLLLDCPQVGNDRVFYYDGSIRCFSKEHGGMAALALVVLFVFIIPPPIIILLLTKGYWRVDPQYISTLTNGLRPQCQWWWTFELVRRLLLVATYVFISHWTTKQVAISLMCVFVLTVHSAIQPYSKTSINVVESCYLFILSTMAVLLIVDGVPNQVFVSILVVPTLHTSILFLYKSRRFCKRRFGRQEQNPGPEASPTMPRYNSLQNDDMDSDVTPTGEERSRSDVLDAVFGSSKSTAFQFSGRLS